MLQDARHDQISTNAPLKALGKVVASFRKLTPAMMRSQQMALSSALPDLTKIAATRAVKSSACALSISGTTYHVLDVLLGLTGKYDWSGSARPVVSISNAHLAHKVRRSERTVTRCIRELVEKNLLAYHDSPTGKRYIDRDKRSGDVHLAFGLDFTPARMRHNELRGLAKADCEIFQEQQRYRKELIGLSRTITDMIDAAVREGLNVSQIEALFEVTFGANLDDQAKLEELRDIRDEILAIILPNEPFPDPTPPPSNDAKMSGAGDTTDPLLQPTTLTYTKRSSEMRASASADDLDFEGRSAQSGPSRRAFEETAGRNACARAKSHQSGEAAGLSNVSIGLIGLATRETQSLLSRKVDTWSALVGAAKELCHLIGLSEAGWKASCGTLGDKLAAAVLVTTAEKALREPDLISKPAGYFRACVARAAEGKLNLDRSLFGLAQPA